VLTAAELQRYARHLSLPQFGRAAQERLKAGKVLVIGAGGLGCPALLYLVAAGVGKITIVDADRVDISNLQRQILYAESDVGELKVEVAARRLRAQNSLVTLRALGQRFCRDNALDLVRDSDVVIDGSDNFATRYLVNDACVIADRPFVYGAIQGFDGQLSVFNWRDGPTYRCLFPSPPPLQFAPNCAEVGVLGILPGILGTWQAGEAIKVLTGVGEPLSGKLLLWNALTMQTRTVSLAADPKSRLITELPVEAAAMTCSVGTWEIDAAELRALLAAGSVQLLDVREDWERAVDAILPSVHIPLHALEESDPVKLVSRLQPGASTVVYCAAGVRSLRAVALLRERYGFSAIRSLRGGMHAWSTPHHM
jgi:molybdopterin/thiamine biosynthesis adenylyltransferase/rhodanese-related sulfurtransferase